MFCYLIHSVRLAHSDPTVFQTGKMMFRLPAQNSLPTIGTVLNEIVSSAKKDAEFVGMD